MKMRALVKGYSWNPLKLLPRNLPCPCQSGKKFKVCHLDLLPAAVESKLAEEYAEGLKYPEQVRFIFDDEGPAVAIEKNP